jgi:hypothetical protein
MKKCTKCKVEKSEEEFLKTNATKSGITGECKNCYNKRKREYLDKDRSRARLANKKSYLKNHEKNREDKTGRSRILREKNPIEYRKVQSEWNSKNRLKVREYTKERNKKPEYKLKRNERYGKSRKECDIFKDRARKIARCAVRSGYLTRPDKCEVCMKECKPHGHHEDYSKPLDVQWLCRICHNHKHGKLMDLKP